MIETLSPLEIIQVYDESSDHRIKRMFKKLGDRTIDCLCDGSISLATLWESAWNEGNGDTIQESRLSLIDKNTLNRIYNDKIFLESFQLTDSKYEDALTIQ
jgi:hypothetical protein